MGWCSAQQCYVQHHIPNNPCIRSGSMLMDSGTSQRLHYPGGCCMIAFLPPADEQIFGAEQSRHFRRYPSLTREYTKVVVGRSRGPQSWAASPQPCRHEKAGLGLASGIFLGRSREAQAHKRRRAARVGKLRASQRRQPIRQRGPCRSHTI